VKPGSIRLLAFWTVAAVVVAALLALMVCAYRGAQISLEAERTHQAYLQVLEALTRYVAEKNAQWPRNCQDLSDFALQYDPSEFDRLRDVAELRRRVDVRFDVTCDEVAAMDSDRFSAVKPIGPNYGENLTGIEGLKEACRHELRK
jgi:hypothetical protein